MAYPPLLPWYDANRRALPFRGTRDPYAVWVSEIMLQQTRTETVGAYYTRFMARFPSVRELAAASEQEVLKYWEGLGYYSRARNLRRAAQLIAAEYGGVFPRAYAAIRALPGVGDYTAAAVASIAFGLPCPAVDGNLTRVLARLHGVREAVEIPSVKRGLLALAQENIDRTRPGDWNQALMDLGATLCVPGTPECARCPLSALCDARAQGDAELLPLHAAGKAPVPVEVGVALVTCGQAVLVQQREAALLRGLWVFLLNEGDASRAAMAKRLRALRLRAVWQSDLGDARHIFTHRVWNMRLYHFAAEWTPAPRGCRWADAAALAALPLPTAMKAARRQAMALLTETPPEAGP